MIKVMKSPVAALALMAIALWPGLYAAADGQPPPIQGQVVLRDGERVIVDIGKNGGVDKGVRLVVFRKAQAGEIAAADGDQLKIGVVEIVQVQPTTSECLLVEEASGETIEFGQTVQVERASADKPADSVSVASPVQELAVDNPYTVYNGPQNPTTFTLTEQVMLLFIKTYHWNNGFGTRSPGQIGLKHDDGELYGPWQAAGRLGQGGALNAYWEVEPFVVLKPGRYTVIDSEPSSWATNQQALGRGFATIRTIPVTAQIERER